MAKWKAKIISKVLSNKKTDSHEQQNDNDYFHNIVPPISNNIGPSNSSVPNNSNPDSPISSSNNVDFQRMHNLRDSQATSSFVIPLNENLQQTYPNSQNNYFDQQQKFGQENNINTMDLISFKNNFKIPKALSFEIRTEKIKQLLMSLLSLIVVIISSTFIGFYFSKIGFKYIPHPVLIIPLLFFSMMILAVNLVEYFSFKREIDLYIEKTLKGSLMPPNFIIRNYRKIHGRLIIFNWLFTFCYIILGLITLIMYLISGQKLTFLFQSWSVTVPELMAEAVTLSVILAILLFIHMMNFVFFKRRKTNIISYYGYEVVSPGDLEIYKKKINRICMIITICFLAIIFFAIVIPIWVVKRKKKK